MTTSEKSASFVYQMEQVLSVYERPYDANFPVVCMDESPKQVIDYIDRMEIIHIFKLIADSQMLIATHLVISENTY